MPTTTSNYSLLKPLVNNATDQDLWGGYLNDDMDDIDTLLRSGITVATQSSQTTGFAAGASISVKKLYPCDATGGGFSVTIPAAATAANGATVFIKKTDSGANVVTLARSGSDTLDGSTSLSLSSQNDIYGLVSDGVSAWYAITRPSSVSDASTSVKGIIQIASNAEAIAGVDALKAVTSAGLASAQSLSANGYIKLPGGVMFQWGMGNSVGNNVDQTITLPTPFSSSIYAVQVTPYRSTQTSDDGAFTISNLTTSSFQTTNNTSGGAFAPSWWAVGK